jgi:hypothetical protein
VTGAQMSHRTRAVSSVHYVYAGLTYDMEGDFTNAARSYNLARRLQSEGALASCVSLQVCLHVGMPFDTLFSLHDGFP